MVRLLFVVFVLGSNLVIHAQQPYYFSARYSSKIVVGDSSQLTNGRILYDSENETTYFIRKNTISEFPKAIGPQVFSKNSWPQPFFKLVHQKQLHNLGFDALEKQADSSFILNHKKYQLYRWKSKNYLLQSNNRLNAFSVENQFKKTQQQFFLSDYITRKQKDIPTVIILKSSMPHSKVYYEKINLSNITYAFKNEEMKALEQLARYDYHKKRKLKTQALFFSALVPGLGSAYARNYWGAAQSVLTFGSAAYQSHRTLNQHGVKHVLPWFYVGSGIFFYVRSLFKASADVAHYNIEVQKQYLLKLEEIYQN